jgi:hypothetical protein
MTCEFIIAESSSGSKEKIFFNIFLAAKPYEKCWLLQNSDTIKPVCAMQEA